VSLPPAGWAIVDALPVVALALIAGAGSFTHIRNTAAQHGQRGPGPTGPSCRPSRPGRRPGVPSPAGRPSRTDSDAALLASAAAAGPGTSRRHGQPITRDTLRARLGISNQLASDLLRQIRGPETKMTAR
jgi:hypothetical protein